MTNDLAVLAEGLIDGNLPAVEYELVVEGESPPSPWRVLSVEIEEWLSGDYQALVEMENDDGREAGDALLGASVTLWMRRRGYGERKLSGILRQVRFRGVDRAGRSHYAVHLEPAFACLDEGLNTRSFRDLTVPEILREILKEGLGPYRRRIELNLAREHQPPDAVDAFARREWCVQYGESTYEFARRLMAEEGLTYHFDQTGDTETVVIVDGNAQLPELAAPVPFHQTDGHVTNVEAVTGFEITMRRSAGRVSLRGTNLTSMAPELSALVDSRAQDPGATARPAGDPGEEERYDPAAPLVLHGYAEKKYRYSNTEGQTRLRLEEEIQRRRTGRGSGFALSFRAGAIFMLASAGPFAGKYLLTRVRHVGRAPGGRSGDGTLEGSNYVNDFDCMPAATEFRPARSAKPHARFDLAQVTAVSDEQIWTDDHGRVKLRFQWDRSPGEPSEADSCWVPVVLGWAGPGYGLQIVPRKGMMVVVGYLGGDPDRPVVTGCLPTAVNTGPVELPGRKSRLSLRTRSLRKGEDGWKHFNEIALDDDAARELMYFRAGWDCRRETLNDDHTEIGNRQEVHVAGESVHTVDKDAVSVFHGSRTQTVDHDDRRIVHGNDTLLVDDGGRSTEVKRDDKLSVHGDRETAIDRDDRLHVRGNGTVQVDEVLTVKQGSTTVEWAEGHVDVQASSWIRIKHGGAEIHLDEDGRVAIATDKEVEIASPGTSILLGDGKAAIRAAQELTLTAGTGAIKLDATGTAISGTKVSSSGTLVNEVTGMLVKVN